MCRKSRFVQCSLKSVGFKTLKAALKAVVYILVKGAILWAALEMVKALTCRLSLVSLIIIYLCIGEF